MRILMLGWDLPPFTSGGLGLANHFLCKSLSQQNVDITFVVLEGAEKYLSNAFMKVLPATNFDVRSVRAGSIYDSGHWMVRSNDRKLKLNNFSELVDLYTEGVIDLIKDMNVDFDLVHANDWLTAIAGIKIKQTFGLPLVTHFHATEYDRSGGGHGNQWVSKIEYEAVQCSDKVLAVSGYTGELLKKHYGLEDSRLIIAHNGPVYSLVEEDFDWAKYSGVIRYLEMLKFQDWSILLNVGRQTFQKNLPNMYKAVQQVISKKPRTLLIMSGSGEMKNELLDLAADLEISDKILWSGFVPEGIKKKFYELADLLLMPSLSEPFGLTPFEALEENTLSLVSKTSGILEVLPSLVAVDAWDVDKMASEALDLLNNSQRREAAIVACQQELSSISWDKTAESVRRVYSELLEKKS